MKLKASALLRLYPHAWRERYGDEVMALAGETPLSATAAWDLVRGAADAWRRETQIDVVLGPLAIAISGGSLGRWLRSAGPSPGWLRLAVSFIFVALAVQRVGNVLPPAARRLRGFLTGVALADLPAPYVAPSWTRTQVWAMLAFSLLSCVVWSWSRNSVEIGLPFESCLDFIGPGWLAQRAMEASPWREPGGPSWRRRRRLDAPDRPGSIR